MIYVFYFIAILSLSQASNLIRLGQAPIEMMGSYRMIAASAVMLGLAFFSQGSRKWPQKPREWILLCISGFIFFLHLWTYGKAMQTTYISMGMIIFSTNPLFTAVGNYVWFKEKISLRLAIAYVLAAGGLYILMTQSSSIQSHHSSQLNPTLGNILVIISSVLFSAYVLTGKAARKYVDNSVYTGIAYPIVALGFFTTGVIKGVSFTDYPTTTWMAIAGLILFPTLLGHALFTYLYKHMNVNVMSCGKLSEPLWSSLVALVLFGENITNETILAFTLTSSGLLILFLPESWMRWIPNRQFRKILGQKKNP